MSDAERLRDLTVIENDDGIRPAGPKNACFYCKSKIGQKHSYTCAIVEQEVELVAMFDRYDETVTFRIPIPFFWKGEDIDHHFNQGMWCADNLFVYVREDEKAQRVLESAHEKLVKHRDGCLCNYTTIEFVKVIDKGPFIPKRNPHDEEEEEHP
jgi:hypothetical protein